MENSWQMKCSSSTQPMASSTQQEQPRNRMETDSGHYIYPHVAQDLRSTMHGRMLDSMFPNDQNLSSGRPGQAELANSFLALLSAPPSLLQCDSRDLSNPRAFSVSSSKLPIEGSGVTTSAVASVVPATTIGILSEHGSNENAQRGVNLCPVVSSRGVANSNRSSSSIVQDGLKAANVGLLSADASKAVIHQLVPGDKAKFFSSRKAEWHGTCSANTGKIRSSNIPISQEVPLEANSSLSSQSSISTRGCPRVICLGTSGDLLLSNTGLLGIICSCHHLHMSVAKFCEHLGLYDVNPGIAVRMESGVTVAQWRKHYFQKLGIRVPDDQSGWEWPEAISATAGLVKSSVALPNMLNNSDFAKLVGSSGGLTDSGQPFDSVVFPKNPHTHQNLLNVALKEQKGGQDRNNNLLKGLVNTLQSNLHPVVNDQIMECPTSVCSTLSKLVDRGPDSGLQSISTYIDSLVKSRNSSITHPTSRNLRTFGKNYDVGKIKNAYDGVIADKDAAASSNIELRLGQPYQQSQSPATNCGDKVESRQYFQCSAGSSNLSARGDRSQLNFGNHVFGMSNAIDTAKVDKFDGNVTKSSVVASLTHFNCTPPERNANSKANNNMVSSDHIMRKSVLCESHATKSNLVGVPSSVGNGSERQLNFSELGFLRHTDKGKGVGCIADGSYLTVDSESKIQKQLGNLGNFTGALRGSCDPCFSPVHDMSHCSRLSSGVPPDAFDARSLSKLPCIGSGGHIDQSYLRSMGSRQNFQSQAVSMANASSTSTTIPGMTPAVLKPDGIGLSPYLLDDSMRLLALRQILELSKQQHAVSSHEMERERGKLNNLSNINVGQSFVDPSTFGEQILRPNLASQQNVSVTMVSPPSGAYTRLGVNIERSAPVTGLNSFCDLSTSAQRNPILFREIDSQFQFPHDPFSNKQLSLRSDNATPSSEHTKCCHGVSCAYFRCHHGCATYTKCVGGNCESRVGSNTFKEVVGNVNSGASMPVASEFGKDHIGPKEKTISLDERGKLKEQIPKNTVCLASQWRDVPSKFKGASNVRCLDQSTDVLDRRTDNEDQLGEADAKCSYGTLKIPDPLKEQEMSNVSSGCSAAAVTQASVQVNNMGFSTLEAVDTRYVNNPLIDEGSGVDECWSSDDALESERSAEFLGSNSNTNFSKQGSSKVLNNQSSRSLLDELKLIDSLTWKKSRNQVHTRLTLHGKSNLKKSERSFKSGKRKREKKLKMLEAPFPAAGTGTLEPCPSKDVGTLHSSVQETNISGACSNRPSSRCGRSTVFSSKEVSRKRDLHMIYGDRDEEDTSDSIRKSPMPEPTHADTKNTMMRNSIGSMKTLVSCEVNICYIKARPVVCGKYGELSSGKLTGDVSRPVKFGSLSRILKTASRTLPKNCKPKQNFQREIKNTDLSVEECTNRDRLFSDELSISEKESNDESEKNCSTLNITGQSKANHRSKEIRKRSLFELTVKGKKPSSKSFSPTKISRCVPKRKVGKISKNAEGTEPHVCGSFRVNDAKSNQEHRSLSSMHSDAFCCVCGGSDNVEINCLLECNRCFIKVHQACYGVSTVPKGHWYCRPCRTDSKDIVCVLCGYGGGAMTRAFRSRTIVKSLLKAWNVETECIPKNAASSVAIMEDNLNVLHSSGSINEGNAFPVLRPLNFEPSTAAALKVDLHQLEIVQNSSGYVSNLKVHNSITAGILDSTVKQWVHMVCGLWTPETRCPNVDTMSAFDVSGAFCSKADVICSICNRTGGSCIQCRVVNCSVHFHPWCAHQKGLLQSEVEGVENESVGFYGRCVLHATHPLSESGSDPIDIDLDHLGEKKLTCARTEGYKGRKRDGFWHNLYGHSKGKSGCLVPQEQLNAWTHINGQKSCTPGLPKLPVSDVEYDSRKEYARYKQTKSWKHLVVYKSGIHALGLYTSRFISRGEMVVEYVGEIVGLRVADKRENEYQSGRKLQYKSACYFFRIDKEHIIDATCKGGIARFVNHSCLPNCVAKVISVRNEKKVVFFAERDIYPGEEITYDYHFNHEDEGKKIPCFCNSKNCRRYMN